MRMIARVHAASWQSSCLLGVSVARSWPTAMLSTMDRTHSCIGGSWSFHASRSWNRLDFSFEMILGKM
jgi:hypothetical protein